MNFPNAFISAMNGARYQRFKGNLEAASAYYDQALAALPFQYDALFEKAEIYLRLKKTNEANALLHTAAKHADNLLQESRALYTIAFSSDETSRRSLLLSARQKAPSIDDIVKNDYSQLAKQAEAECAYKKALEFTQIHTTLISFSPNTHYLQGTLFEYIGDYIEARRSYEIASTMGHKQAKEKLQQVESGKAASPAMRGTPKYIGRPIRIKDETTLRGYNAHEGVSREQDASFYDAHFTNKPGQTTPESVLRLQLDALERIVALTGYDQITEIGCGAGIFLETLQRAGKTTPSLRTVVSKYVGFDFSTEAVIQAQKRNPGFEKQLLQGNSYDQKWYKDGEIFCSFEVLEHLDDLCVINNIPSGAYLIATVPNFGDPGHVRVYNPQIIMERWNPLLHIKQIQEIESPKVSVSWYVVVGVKR